VNNNGEPAQLFHNEGGIVIAPAKSGAGKNHWLAVHLIGTKSNRDGLGARFKLTAGNFVSYDQAKGGMSYCSSQDPRIYFGLAERAKVDTVEITWPSGIVDTLHGVTADQIITVEEGHGLTAYRFPKFPPR
jgi:hypothetical protein